MAQPALSATVDKRDLSVDDQLVLSLTVEGVRDAPPPILPPLPDFDVTPAGTSQNMQIVNGAMSVRVERNFILTPKRAGTLTIGPARVQLGGTVLQSQPITVRVTPPGKAPAGDGPVIVRAEIDQPRAFVGQQLVYTVQVMRRVQIANARLEPPSFEGLSARDLGQRDGERVLGGERWAVTEIRKALVPTRPGKVTIAGPALSCTVILRGGDPFFDDPIFGGGRGKRVTVRGPAVELDVQPMPPAPPGFSGLVGAVTLEAQVTPVDLAVGESATLTMTVRAPGPPSQIPAPKLELPAGVRAYEDKPVEQAGDGDAAGTRTFKTALVPSQPGEVVIPAPSLVYLDAATGRFERAGPGSPIRLHVRPAAGGAQAPRAPGVDKREVKLEGEDLLPQKVREAALETDRIDARALATSGAMVGVPGLGAFVMLLRSRRGRRTPEAEQRERKSRALRRLRGALAAGQGAEAVAGALRAYLGDKLDLAGSALAPREASERLAARGVDAGLCREVGAVLEACEAAVYGGGAADARALGARAEAVAGRLERVL